MMERASKRRPPARGMPLAARAITVIGRVQGVGFRPFVHGLAAKHSLAGYVRNVAGEVLIHVEGSPAGLSQFEAALVREAPPLARPSIASSRIAPCTGKPGFEIAASEGAARSQVHLPPDQFVCDDCLAELGEPKNRRYRHPFITCTQCGPRYTLIEALPYDRERTSMAGFELCPRCRAEYEDPADRRFHAEPLCCPDCGPRLKLVSGNGEVSPIMGDEAALAAALGVLRDGGILGVKGVGGYHLMCDAASDTAVRRLRERKRRPDKPLAVMFATVSPGARGSAHESTLLDEVAARALADPVRPIVLVPRRAGCRLSRHIAPGLDEVGAMLPYSPLHHLLITDFGAPLVATSGNVSGEPVITEAQDAQRRLAGICDAFLHHDRPIVRPADDPVLRIIDARPRSLRLGRGSAPLELSLPIALREPALALGGQMKATVALGSGARAVVSPHIGDLGSPRALDVLGRIASDIPRLYGEAPERIVCDAHPGYATTRWARRQGLPVTTVQHHAAHASALAGEHPGIATWLVFAWDGVGYGEDGSLWGGEALLGRPGHWRRVASFRPFRPPGGDFAARAPWRSAAALMWEAGRSYRPPLDNDVAEELVRAAWGKGIASPATSAVGRLFDAAAALIMGIDNVSYEGAGPMQLESLAREVSGECECVAPQLARDAAGVFRTDWSDILDMITDNTLAPAIRAHRFHATMAAALVAQAVAIRDSSRERPFEAVGLAGGVFQNRLLTEQAIPLLARHGFEMRLPMQVPANDGGLAYGQLVEAAAILDRDSNS